MVQINLAPGSQYLIAVRRRRRVLYGTSAIIAVGAIIVGATLSIMASRAANTKEELEQQLQSVETQIAQASETVKRIQLFEQRLATLGELMAKHLSWTLYAQEIERLLPVNTILTSIQGNHDSGTIDLLGSTPNIDSAAQVLASLKQQAPTHTTLFTDGTISNIQQAIQTGSNGQVLGQRYNFNMTLKFATPSSPTP